MDKPIKAPFPWFGGKSKAAPLIWSRLGADCGNYVEPFFGSGAVWHGRPKAFKGWAVVNDLDGHVCNVWRSMKYSPKAVANAACWPVNEADLHARHLWLVQNRERLTARLMADPEYHEPRAAGWWIWGACCWIGSGWCSGAGSWGSVLDAEGVPVFARVDSGFVVNQVPHLGDGGKGVSKQVPMLTWTNGVHSERPNNRLDWLRAWFAGLSASMDGVRVTCGGWERVCSVGTMTRNGSCAVVMDPPYSQTDAVYAKDSNTVAHDVRAWCLENGGNPNLRIALCGHVGEHEELQARGWTVETWAKNGGYQGADDRERIWFSPHCLKPQTNDLGLF